MTAAERPATGTGATSEPQMGATSTQIEDAIQLYRKANGNVDEKEMRVVVGAAYLIAPYLVPDTHMIIRRDAWDAITALLEAGESRGGDAGVWFPLGKVQDAENAEDATEKEMGE